MWVLTLTPFRTQTTMFSSNVCQSSSSMDVSNPRELKRDCPIVDFGAHLYPENAVPKSYVRNNPLASKIGAALTDPAVVAKRYAKSHIDAAVLSQPYYMGHHDPDCVSRANDTLLKIIEEYDQFYGLAAVPQSDDPEANAQELSRSLENGYNGGAIQIPAQGHRIIDSELEPVFEVANQTRAPILVHPKLTDSIHPDVLDDRYLLNAVFGRETSLAASLFSAINAGIFEQYQDLTLIFHHYGGNIAGLIGRIRGLLDDGRWPDRQEHVLSYEAFRTTLEKRVYIDTSGFFGTSMPFQVATEVFPPSQILLATDHPYECRSPAELNDYVRAITEHAPWNNSRRIAGRNALDLLENY